MNKAPISGHSTKQEFPDRGSVVQTQCSSNEGVWVVGDINRCDYTARDARIAAENAEKERQAQIAATPPPVAQTAPKVVTSTSMSAQWEALKQCESGGNYANKRNPNYRGAYQFGFGTWASVGGSGDPADASPAEQDMRAQLLFNQRGWQPWECASILGF